jgi:hypothetical protein
LRSTFHPCVVVVLDDVVEVAAPRWSGAPREHARAIAQNDVLADPVRDRVRRRGELGVEVDDGLDGDRGAGVATPTLDLVEEDVPLALLEAAGGTEDGGVAGQGGAEVGVEDDLAGSGQVVAVRIGTGQVEGGLGAGEVTESRLSVERRASRPIRGPSTKRRRG